MENKEEIINGKEKEEKSKPKELGKRDKSETNELIEQSREETKRLEEANKRREEILEREEALQAKKEIGGRAEAGHVPPVEKKLTDAEIADKVMTGEINPLQADGFI